ncbi:TrmH family RNA methyltransferase [Spartinivicinus poritis]|uniref:TrmH family RNA methyltransferase n=1 Tax=Spartinivicinus poritis TaxID=2994640 RepID=A0ABT5U906_9GAMM|nr:TrmH family RNA methyltransferase [Spartinivicinus sp. A2-2]MDE1462858.1 TrmH family RNA methyltransferase [Spartinivicinus sp. A2-2]
MSDFCTVLHSLNSPQNVGMIVRSHIAHGGNEIVFIGHELPWQFKKGSQSFSRKLEKQAEIIHLPNPDDVFEWCMANSYTSVAIEIAEQTSLLNQFTFPEKTALIVGNEADGLPTSFIKKCAHVVTIPQYGPVGSLNVAVSASIAMYELRRGLPAQEIIKDEFNTEVLSL